MNQNYKERIFAWRNAGILQMLVVINSLYIQGIGRRCTYYLGTSHILWVEEDISPININTSVSLSLIEQKEHIYKYGKNHI